MVGETNFKLHSINSISFACVVKVAEVIQGLYESSNGMQHVRATLQQLVSLLEFNKINTPEKAIDLDELCWPTAIKAAICAFWQ